MPLEASIDEYSIEGSNWYMDCMIEVPSCGISLVEMVSLVCPLRDHLRAMSVYIKFQSRCCLVPYPGLPGKLGFPKGALDIIYFTIYHEIHLLIFSKISSPLGQL